MNAYLITNAKDSKQREIWIAKDAATAFAKSNIPNREVRKICDAVTYLKSEKTIQKIWLGNDLKNYRKKARA